MSILGILTALWFFKRSRKLKETKDIEKYVLTCPTRIKDRDGYIKFYSKIYYRSGISLIIFEIFCMLNKYFFDLPIGVLLLIFGIIFIAAFIESIVIDKKSKKFIY
ncbi:hypothetical protein UT300012_35410 [Paraclostridium bifermentans]|uniref:hypothetical protein n=1 Tax=Paraclostridium bifermentans TaxID=1490 RepID=UPI001C1095D1|nr:hypothetical protein [Paraclostridium bifermentans]MBS5954585.1 hypothetical protein [Paraclostridium bifermentans]MBU5289688.1 hypothetical protein [Paraclostridium bifermentans]